MSKLKNLYLGMMQTRKKVFVERCMATSEKQAKNLFIRRIAKKQGIPYNLVADWFSDEANYSIKIEVEYKEDENG